MSQSVSLSASQSLIQSQSASQSVSLLASLSASKSQSASKSSQPVSKPVSHGHSVTASQSQSVRLITLLHCWCTKTQTNSQVHNLFSPHILYFRSTDISVSIVTRLWTGRPISHGSNPGKRFSVLQHSDRLWTPHPSQLYQSYFNLLPRGEGKKTRIWD